MNNTMPPHVSKLKDTYEKCNSVLCVGLDLRIHEVKKPEEALEYLLNTSQEIINTLNKEHLAYTFKFNYAFFAQLGYLGLKTLYELIEKNKKENFIILDFKRSDIESTMETYAKEAIFYNPDAVTLVPFFGEKSLMPFINLKSLFSYVVLYPSNQDGQLVVNSTIETKGQKKRIYEYLYERLHNYENIGFVIPFNETLLKEFHTSYLLMPGLGAQGYVLTNQKKYLTWKHRVNVSRSILYPENNKTIVESALYYNQLLKL